MYTGYKVVLVETGEPKHTEEVTGLGTVALPCQQELMTFLGNLLLVLRAGLRLVKANMYHQHTSNSAAELAHVRAHSKSNFFCSAKLTDAPRCIMGRKHPILLLPMQNIKEANMFLFGRACMSGTLWCLEIQKTFISKAGWAVALL